MEQPKIVPAPQELLAVYLQAGELQFKIKAHESHLAAVNQRINELLTKQNVLQEALAQQKQADAQQPAEPPKEAPLDPLPAAAPTP